MTAADDIGLSRSPLLKRIRARRTASEILRDFGLPQPPSGAKRYYAKCPQCSHTRSAAHRNLKCLGITIDGKGVRFGCNHCDWHGGAYYNGKDHDPVVATYEYTDESGAVLFRKVKTAKKNFWQERTDGRGGWIRGIKGVRRVLYRLPELVEAIANERVILVPEGERDVDSLHKLNVPATCNSEGANKPGQIAKWRPQYSETLRGADIVILPDHDPAGYAHADAIAKMTTGIAKSIRMLKLVEHWPDCPKGGDVSDWIARGGTREKLDDLIARAKPWVPSAETEQTLEIKLDDFVAYLPMHNYIFIPTREMWPGRSVNTRLPPVLLTNKNGTAILDEEGKEQYISASQWLDPNRAVEQMTWAPGDSMLIRDRLVSDGGWIKRKDVTCFNLYRPPIIDYGDPTKAGPWLDHVRKVFADDTDHIIRWLAHRVQRPGDKVNHALVLGGAQGIGKDSMLEPVKRAIGPWNFSEVSPQQMLGRFNGFLKSVILRISEARDLGDVDRFGFYDHMKAYTAAPPDVLRVDEKHIREHAVFNCCGVIITTNHKSDGIYLPADDRRHFVAWSDRSKEDFNDGYWQTLWRWYDQDGDRHVAAYLTDLDLTSFDPKAPPPKTPAFWTIVDASRAPEDAELADVLDQLGKPGSPPIPPDAVTLIQIINHLDKEDDFRFWLKDRRNRRVIPHRMESCGYIPVRNDAAKDGLWKIGGRRMVIYAKAVLSIAEQIEVANRLVAKW